MASSPQQPQQPQAQQYQFDVVIVGAGVAGCSAAYHLQKHHYQQQQQQHQQEELPSLLVLEAAGQAGHGVAPRQSGSATMEVAPCIKMMVQIFAGSTEQFVAHHGRDGARRYLRATQQGLVLQKAIAKTIATTTTTTASSSTTGGVTEHMKELGSYYVTDTSKEMELKQEFELLQSLGGCCEDMEWCDKDRLASVVGMSSDFDCGIYFPKDAIIDSSWYAKTLLQYTLDHYNNRNISAGGDNTTTNNNNHRAQFWPHSKVVNIQEYNTTTSSEPETCSNDPYVMVELESGVQIRAKHVIMATGGLYQNIPHLNGLLKPCYSYLVHVPIHDPAPPCECSPNFFTWGFSHDWCFTKGRVRCSGEDHFSAYKAPKLKERCANLSRWTLERYHQSYDHDLTTTAASAVKFRSIPQQYGIYSETPDMAPLIGHLTKNSRICYLLGCNAWGQSILSYCGSLVPGLLGLRELSEDEKDSLRLVSIRRFSALPT